MEVMEKPRRISITITTTKVSACLMRTIGTGRSPVPGNVPGRLDRRNLMSTSRGYIVGWMNTSINDFLDEMEHPSPATAYALITCLDSNPDVSSVFQGNNKLVDFKRLNIPIGQGVLMTTKNLIAANKRTRIFFGFDEIWFFPNSKITPKPHEVVITRPPEIDLQDSSLQFLWMKSNKCSLGLGDGEGMNYCLKVQGAARYVVQAFNETISQTAGEAHHGSRFSRF